MNFDDNWTSCIDLIGSDHPRVHTEQVACCVKKANGKWRMCVDYRALNTRTV